MAGKKWRFELFYWDYVIGVLLLSVIFAFTLGSSGEEGRGFLEDIRQADFSNILSAMIGGVIFNAANILLVAAIAIAGMSVAFPVGIGLALVIGVLVNYMKTPEGNPVILFAGVGFVVVAILFNAAAYKRLPGQAKGVSTKGLVLSVLCGILMGFFYRFVANSITSKGTIDFMNLEAGKLSPYTAVVFFSIGVLLSNFLFNTLIMKKPFVGKPVPMSDYFKGGFPIHLIGMLGGIIWCIGMSFSIIASGQAGPAISYGLGQGATMVAAFWGVFIWKEFKEAPKSGNKLIALMFFCFVVGLGLIITARVVEFHPDKQPEPITISQARVVKSKPDQQPESITISKEKLKDKIKGAWAAQTIGVTFGSPVEFQYNGTMIQDYQVIPWNDSSLKDTYKDHPGVYDDIYMDLSFVQVIEDEGIDAPAESFANAFAHAEYSLWFANQTARYNILNGISPPQSGHWLNNPCADDIDFQIEADFAGIMCPGMVNSAAEICDKVGHIMNYGDGWYGGVYVAAMYALAFVSDDIGYIVEEALKVIPAESKFAQTMSDVIRWHRENPDDWKETWFKVHRKWSEDIGSPNGVFSAFNIDAKINAAWVLMGLLYGDGDFTRTFEIATRCGDDADCNPASAGGILATIKGYENIPEFWKKGLSEVEDVDFKYTTISLNDAYELSFKHALDIIERSGGSVGDEEVTIKFQEPKTVPFEVAFEGHYPIEKINLGNVLTDETSFEFEGNGFAVNGVVGKIGKADYTFDVEMWVDGELIEKAKLPTKHTQRRFTLFWKYQLPMGKHKVLLKVVNPVETAAINLSYAVVYSDKPVKAEY
jgi:glucose uptake protein GlcU